MLLAFALYGGSFHGMEHEYSSLFRWLSLVIGLVVLLGPGSLFFRGAIAALRTRTAHLDLPIAIGLGAGAIAGTVNTLLDRGEIYFDSLTGLVFLLLVGRYIQRRLERRAADSVERLFSLTPAFAHVREGEEIHDISIDALEIDQHVEVHPGESFPADGVVIEGESSIDLSLLTGESRPVAATVDDAVFAGAVNLQRPLIARVTALGRDTRVGKLLSLMDECAQRKAPIVQLADRVAGYFTVAALALFAATFIAWRFIDPGHALDHAVSLLIVSCPCGLGLATPFAVSVALGRAARASILVKGGEVLEKLSNAGSVAPLVYLDKTGTLTESGLRLLEWHGDAQSGRGLAPAIAELEAQVSHPVARALATLDDWNSVLTHAGAAASSLPAAHVATTNSASSIDPPSAGVSLVETARAGIVGVVNHKTLRVGSEQFVLSALTNEGGRSPNASESNTLTQSISAAQVASQAFAQRCLTPVWIALNQSVVGVVGVGSAVRPDAAATVAALRNRGLDVAILSGDDAATVAAVGRELGLAPAQCHGALSPEDKLHIVQRTTEQRPTFMVGDGVNDAAALSAATVGIAVHVYLGRAGVGVLIELLEGSTRTVATIRRCLYVSLGYNLVAAALATTGFINALVAAILMPLASFSVLGIALGAKTFAVTQNSGKV
jgi:Cu2+-exporting ATPase